MTRDDRNYERLMTSLRSRYWESLPTRAYKLRRLVRKLRSNSMQPGEREELELMVQRLADSGSSFGFEEVTEIGGRMADIVARQRQGEGELLEELESACDDLDRFIDDMTIEALVMRLRAVLA